MLNCRTWTFLLLAFLLISCGRRWSSEIDEVHYWNGRVAQPAFDTLYKNGNIIRALQVFDSLRLTVNDPGPFLDARRHDLTANYHYFFTHNDTATAAAIDSALDAFPGEKLRLHYPRTTVGFLLFGGQIAYRLGHYQKANDLFFQARKLAEEKLSPCERSAYSYNIAMVLYRQQNYRTSAQYFKEAYQFQSTCTPTTTAIILQQQEIQCNIGLCYLELKEADSALPYFQKALTIAETGRDSLGPVFMDKIAGVIMGDLGRVADAQGRHQEAERLYRRSIELNGRPGYEMANAQDVQLHLLELYTARGDRTAAGQVLKNLRASLDTMPNEKVELGWRRSASQHYADLGMSDRSLTTFKSYIQLRDSVNQKQARLTAADVAHKLTEKDQELQITKLRNDNHLSRIVLWLSLLFCLMAVAILVLIYQNYRRNKKSLEESLALNEEIRCQKAAREREAHEHQKRITEAVIRAQERERSVIGLELHDNIGQVLTTVKLQNEMAMQLPAPEAVLAHSVQHLQACIDEIRQLSRQLSAPTLGKIGLEDSIRELIAPINSMGKLEIELVTCAIAPRRFPQAVHLGVYRIVQEQLTNILRHADARGAKIELDCADGQLHLRISDDGKGFDTAQKAEGIGLMNMRTRAESLNGSFFLHSAPGQGCCIDVYLPLPLTESEEELQEGMSNRLI